MASARRLFVHVHRNQRRARVEHGAQRRHQRGKNGRHHDPAQPFGQQADDQQRIGIVAGDIRWPERFRDQAGKHQNEDGQNLQGGAEQRAAPRVLDAPRTERLLHDDLIGAPVPDSQDDRAKRGPGPWIHRVVRRLDHVEEVGRKRGPQFRKATDFPQPDDREHEGAADQNEGLDEVGIDDRRQSTGNRVGAGGQHQQDGGGQVVPPEDFSNEDAPGEQRHRNLREHIREDRHPGQVGAAHGAEATLEKFGHREYAAAQVVRHEQPAEEKETERGRPLIGPDRQAGRCARPGKADEMLARDVGRKDRCADGEPADVLACQKVVSGCALPSRMPEANREDQGEITRDDGGIQHASGPIGRRAAGRWSTDRAARRKAGACRSLHDRSRTPAKHVQPRRCTDRSWVRPGARPTSR